MIEKMQTPFRLLSHSTPQSIGWNHWEEFSDKIAGAVFCRSSGKNPVNFKANVSATLFEGAVLGDIRASSHDFKRDALRVGQDNLDFFYFQQFRKAKTTKIHSFRNTEQVNSGDLIFHNMTVPFSVIHNDYELTTLVLRRDVFSQFLDTEVSYPSFKISRSRAEFSILSSIIEELRVNALTFDQKISSRLLSCVVDLVGSIVGSTRDKDHRLTTENRKFLQFRQAQQLLVAQIANSAATSDSLVEAIRLSRASAYRLFEEHGGVMQNLKGLRLSKSKQLIASDPTIKIQKVAAACGFKSANHFSRAFREEFEISPRDYKATQRQQHSFPTSRYISWALS
ncbi:helix-turn-helix domain-containing protein [Pseudovibrio sp. Ad13]|uniref:helix-turn-helix domain-containing protein n=1 Tax=Pseudovibrio sp. Ad13 TaxID=989396 RepID=UPI000A8E4939|nr:helix-turn-helix domain-containing protein [Pseudovibrio sp. Ad13]